MGDAHIAILAHHGLLLAIPPFAPAIGVAGVVAYVALRDRRAKMIHRDNFQDSSDFDGCCTDHRWMRRIDQL